MNQSCQDSKSTQILESSTGMLSGSWYMTSPEQQCTLKQGLGININPSKQKLTRQEASEFHVWSVTILFFALKAVTRKQQFKIEAQHWCRKQHTLYPVDVVENSIVSFWIWETWHTQGNTLPKDLGQNFPVDLISWLSTVICSFHLKGLSGPTSLPGHSKDN